MLHGNVVVHCGTLADASIGQRVLARRVVCRYARSHMIVCVNEATQSAWQLCLPCFDDEYGIDGVNAPSTNLFLHKVDSVPGSAAVSGEEKDKLGVKRLCGVVVAKGLSVADAPDAILYSEGPMLILSVCSVLETCLMLTG